MRKRAARRDVCGGARGGAAPAVEAGGGAGTIVNMRKNPDGCMNCHLDVKASFNLPYAHPVLSGNAIKRIAESELDEMVVSDTIPLSAQAQASGPARTETGARQEALGRQPRHRRSLPR